MGYAAGAVQLLSLDFGLDADPGGNPIAEISGRRRIHGIRIALTLNCLSRVRQTISHADLGCIASRQD